MVVPRRGTLSCMVERPAPVVRAAGVGAVLFLLVGLERMRRTPVVDWTRAHYAYYWGIEPDWEVTPLRAAAVFAAGGCLWGMACAAVTALLPLPRPISGAAFGVGAVRTIENAAAKQQRRDRSRRAEADIVVAPRTYILFATLGAMTAVLVQRRPSRPSRPLRRHSGTLAQVRSQSPRWIGRQALRRTR